MKTTDFHKKDHSVPSPAEREAGRIPRAADRTAEMQRPLALLGREICFEKAT